MHVCCSIFCLGAFFYLSQISESMMRCLGLAAILNMSNINSDSDVIGDIEPSEPGTESGSEAINEFEPWSESGSEAWSDSGSGDSDSSGSRTYNYVTTLVKPTAVNLSCVGNFTGPDDLNLILAKSTYLEVHLVMDQELKPIAELPIHDKICVMNLFRPRDGDRDLLLLVTERFKFCVLQWDIAAHELITRKTGDLSDATGIPIDIDRISVSDPGGTLIGLHIYDGFLKVLPLDIKGDLKLSFDIILQESRILDIKFMYGFLEPTVVFLYKDKDKILVKTYGVSLNDKALVKGGPWPESQEVVDSGAYMLIAVPLPICGVVMIGRSKIVYYNYNGSTIKEKGTALPIVKSFGKMDDSTYLLGDQDGNLWKLSLVYENQIVTEIQIQGLGATSIVSTLSYLRDERVFVGSLYGNSKLLKVNIKPDTEGSCLEALQEYTNLGPIIDFCVVNSGLQDDQQIVICSGSRKHASLSIVRKGILLKEHGSVEVKGVTGLWSIRSAETDDLYERFLVVSFFCETRIWAMKIKEDKLEEIKIVGVSSQIQTIFCHDAEYNQFIQVTSNSVRLVSLTTKDVLCEWFAPIDSYICVATANASQVLLATGAKHLVYLEIGDEELSLKADIELDKDVSCLDLNPPSGNSSHSYYAAVGMSKDVSVRIYSLPSLDLVFEEVLSGHLSPRSVLFSAFEEVLYLFCGFGDGVLMNFVLDMSTGILTSRKEYYMGNCPVSLRAFSFKNRLHIFAISDRPAVIYSRFRKLVFVEVEQIDVSSVCSFSSAAFPDSLVVANKGVLTVGTFDDIQKLPVRSIARKHEARRICHLQKSCTFALCCVQYCDSVEEESEMHFVHLLDDKTFDLISTVSLEESEYCCSMMTSSVFNEEVICVGTAFVSPKKEPKKGRILVFKVLDRKLNLHCTQDTEGAVYSLNIFDGGHFVAAIGNSVRLYEWKQNCLSDLFMEFVCECSTRTCSLYVQTCGKFIIVADREMSVSLFMYQFDTRTITGQAEAGNKKWMTAVETLDELSFIGAENKLNLFSLQRKGNQLKVVCQYHLGEYVNSFYHSSVHFSEVQTVIFGAASGGIGIIASLSQEQYLFFEQIQDILRILGLGIGVLKQDEWRSFSSETDLGNTKAFLDGDLIESVLDVDKDIFEGISNFMEISENELRKRVEDLTKLHEI